MVDKKSARAANREPVGFTYYAEIAPFGQESTQVPHSEQSSGRANTAVSPKSKQPFGQLSTQVPHAEHESRSIVGLAMSHSLLVVMHSTVCGAQE
jgi:hypothetical protein